MGRFTQAFRAPWKQPQLVEWVLNRLPEGGEAQKVFSCIKSACDYAARGMVDLTEDALVEAIQTAQQSGLPKPDSDGIMQMCQAAAAKEYMSQALRCALDVDTRTKTMLGKAKTAAREAQLPELHTGNVLRVYGSVAMGKLEQVAQEYAHDGHYWTIKLLKDMKALSRETNVPVPNSLDSIVQEYGLAAVKFHMDRAQEYNAQDQRDLEIRNLEAATAASQVVYDNSLWQEMNPHDYLGNSTIHVEEVD